MRFKTYFAVRVLGFCALGAASTLALAQAAAPAKPAVGSQMSPAKVYGRLLSGMEKEFVSAAEAMPEDKYDFVPTTGEYKGVNNFAQQVKHVAEANGEIFHDPAKPMADNSAEFAKLKTKAEIVQALKDSFAAAHVFVDSMTAENAFVVTEHGTRAGMATMGLAHMMDHYGQMVEYLRLNGIIPPASRK
jgi:uncharacterized damage-inducible protein DinB